MQAHVATLRAQGVNASSINQRLTAIRKLATELADNGVIDHSTTQVVSRVEGVRKEGKRLGNWLTKEQVQKLLKLPNVEPIKGLCDHAILAVLLDCAILKRAFAGQLVPQDPNDEPASVLLERIQAAKREQPVQSALV